MEEREESCEKIKPKEEKPPATNQTKTNERKYNSDRLKCWYLPWVGEGKSFAWCVSLAVYFMLLLLKLKQVTDKTVMIMYIYKANELSLL